MTLTLTSTAQPTNDPPRVLLEVAEDDPLNSLQDVVLYRDGVRLRFDPVISAATAIAYDYDAPFDVLLTYRADADELNTAPEWTETWASLASWLSPPSGGAAAGWAVAAGVASSTSPGAVIYRDSSTAITSVDVTAPSNMTLQLADSANKVLGSVTVSTDGKVTLAGSGASSTVTGSGDYVLSVAQFSLSVAGTGWSTQVTFAGTPTRVRLLAPSAVNFVAKYGASGSGSGQFDAPRGIAFDSAGSFFVTDENRKRVLKFNSAGVFQSEFGVSGSGSGQFQKPDGIAIDASDNIWVTDVTRNKLLKFNAAGVFQFEHTGATFNVPRDVAVDSAGNPWVVDANNHRVAKFNGATGAFISAFGTNGTGNGQFSYPHGIAIGPSDNIWVTDVGNNRVQKFNSAGTYQSQFGNTGAAAYRLNSPGWIAVDASSNTYVVDRNNYRVQQYNSSNVFVTQFGTQGGGDSQFRQPSGIDVRTGGDLYVVDAHITDRVKKFTQAVGSVDDLTVLGSGIPFLASATDTETLSPTGDDAGAWITNANQPDLAILVEKDDCGGEPFYLEESTRASTTLTANTVQLAIEGSAEIVTVAVGPRRKETWTLNVVCTTEAARDELLALLADSAAINLRFPAALNYLGLDGGFYAVGDVSTQRTQGPALSEECVVSLPLTPSLAPAYKPLWQWNMRTLAQTGMTMADVNAAYPTMRDLVVGPVEV